MDDAVLWSSFLGERLHRALRRRAAMVLADIYLAGRRQSLPIMEAVWPVTMLYLAPWALRAICVVRSFAYPKLVPTDLRYWLMMQIAMIRGFITTYPVNWWLIRRGIKEAM